MLVAAQKILQSGKTLYLGSMTVEALLGDNFVIDSWDAGKISLDDQGYQREPVAEHVKSIGDLADIRHGALHA